MNINYYGKIKKFLFCFITTKQIILLITNAGQPVRQGGPEK